MNDSKLTVYFCKRGVRKHVHVQSFWFTINTKSIYWHMYTWKYKSSENGLDKKQKKSN